MYAQAAQLEQHRTALTGHCYRMLGSVVDADDAVQETMVRAWRNLERFDGRSALRTWLIKIATNVCIDFLAERKKRTRPSLDGPLGTIHDELVERPRTHWLEPILDAHAIPSDCNPAETTLLRESIRLAFVAALQHLPPKQRAALLLTEVLGWSVAEVAESLETSVPSINSALQRARATMAEQEVRSAAPLSAAQMQMLERYVDAFHRYDVDLLASLCREDVVFSMPPFSLWLKGPDAVAAWLETRGAPCRGSRLIAVSVNGTPGFAQYRCDPSGHGHKAWGVIVLELASDAIATWTTFLDVETLFPKLGLPLSLADSTR